MRFVIVVELDRCIRAKRQRDIGPARCGVETIVLVPTIVEGGLVFKIARRNRPALLPDVVGGIVDQMRRGASRIPVTGTA
jgi:hypothetical protein